MMSFKKCFIGGGEFLLFLFSPEHNLFLGIQYSGLSFLAGTKTVTDIKCLEQVLNYHLSSML